MKKLYFGILLLLLPIICFGQVSGGLITNSAHYSSSSSYTTEYQALLDDWTTDPTGDTLTWQNDLIYSLDTLGVWDGMDVFYVFANVTNDNDEALVNWINPGTHDATLVNAPTFTRLEGFTGNASTNYINLNYNLTDDGVNAIQDSTTIGIYNRVDFGSGTYTDIGAGDADDDEILAVYSSLSNSVALCYVNRSNQVTFSNSNSQGFYVATRFQSDTVEYYKNGSLEAAENQSSTGVSQYDIYILALDSAGTADNYSPAQVSIAFVMRGTRSPTEMADMFTIIETYMDNIGTGVVSETLWLLILLLPMLYRKRRRKRL